MKILGVEFAPFMIPLNRRLQTAAVLYFCTSFLLFGTLGIILVCYLSLTEYFFVPLLYVVWLVYDHETCNRGGRTISFVRRLPIWRYLKDYFPVSLVKTGDLDPKKNYIFGYHPHGIMCVGAFCNFATESTGFSDMYPGIKPHLVTLEGQFWFPLHREFILSTGVCAASKESIEWLLTKEGTGNAVVIVIGGAAEALDARPGMVTLTLQRRKGFVRLAMKHGASLVPVFAFGENDVYDQVDNPDGSRLRRIQNYLTKSLGFSPPLFHGRGVFQYNIGYLPYRRPVVNVVGRPLDVEKIENPTPEQVNSVHKQYIERLQELFEEFKEKYGSKDLKLTVA